MRKTKAIRRRRGQIYSVREKKGGILGFYLPGKKGKWSPGRKGERGEVDNPDPFICMYKGEVRGVHSDACPTENTMKEHAEKEGYVSTKISSSSSIRRKKGVCRTAIFTVTRDVSKGGG